MTSMTNFRARPTTYAGIQMRSRLEAHFAQWLDAQGFTWTYEPNCYAGPDGQYLPDFKVEFKATPGTHRFYEVKPPTANLDEALAKMHVILESEHDGRLEVVHRDRSETEWITARSCWPNGHGCGRCDRTFSPHLDQVLIEDPSETAGPTTLILCARCGHTAVQVTAGIDLKPPTNPQAFPIAYRAHCTDCHATTTAHIIPTLHTGAISLIWTATRSYPANDCPACNPDPLEQESTPA